MDVFTLIGILMLLGVASFVFRVLRAFWRAGRSMARVASLPNQAPVRFVIDGDTLQVGDLRVRLAHIDAPEKSQMTRDGAMPAGKAATAALTEMVRGKKVDIQFVDEDAYGRVVARLLIRGTDVGLELISRGLAVADSTAPRAYRSTEKAARRMRVGIWAHGGIVPPSEFRRELA